jgi:hypothetical protein
MAQSRYFLQKTPRTAKRLSQLAKLFMIFPPLLYRSSCGRRRWAGQGSISRASQRRGYRS